MAGLCILVYGLCLLSNGPFQLSLVVSGAFRSSTLLRFGVLGLDLGWEEPWRLLAACFLHFGILHIGMNLLSLVSLGRTLEPHFGSARFAILYVVTGIGGFFVSQLWYDFRQPGAFVPTAGASGAIFGLVGAFVGVLWARKHPNWSRVLVNYLVYAAIIGFVLPANNAAHVGGFVTGIAVGALFERERQPRRRDGLMKALAGLCLVACVGSLVLSARSPVYKRVKQAEVARQEEQERRRLDSE
jgi:membrane associated rhomboid family serine protease